MTIPFDNTYARLPTQMFTAQDPVPVTNPQLIVVNTSLAAELGIDPRDITADLAAGNAVPAGATPIAQLYAGHQFGNWNPQLGDGRAILLGEVIDYQDQRRDIQLKGAGRTPYSRGGDGRAWLGPVLREYLVSEAMHAMGVPTTRALAAVTTGEPVYRDSVLPGAILTRVASSHIRVGTFQIFAARGDVQALQALLDYSIARHAPEAATPEDFLDVTVARQASLVAKWLGLGFIHGVMNTDNAAVSGETIDYGPCAFLDDYDPTKVFSSIDRHGRYAYQNQPRIAAWNLAQLATALLPLMPDQDAAIEDFTQRINNFGPLFEQNWRAVFATKLGILQPTAADDRLISDLLTMMEREGLDFTQTFAALSLNTAQPLFTDQTIFEEWQQRWIRRRAADFATIMAQHNPQVIPRNHQIEAVINAAVDGDFAPFHTMLAAITDPYSPLDEARAPFAAAPAPDQAVTATFCGT